MGEATGGWVGGIYEAKPSRTFGSRDTSGFVSVEQARAFQELFRERRKQLGLSQMDAAAKSSVSQTLISSLERGPHMGMRLIDLLKVLQVYRIAPNEVAEVLGYYTAPTPLPTTTAKDAEEQLAALAVSFPRLLRLVRDIEEMEPEQIARVEDALDLLVRGAALFPPNAPSRLYKTS